MLGIERHQRQATTQCTKYSIQQIIIAGDSTVLPNNQKKICSNRTISRLEKGDYFNNDLLYINLSRKLNRSYAFHPLFNQTIDYVVDGLIDYLALEKTHSSYYFMSHLDLLKDTSLIFYKEIYELLLQCVQFLIGKKTIDITPFETLPAFFDLLPIKLQFIFGYTLSLHQLYEKNNVDFLNEFLLLFHSYKDINKSMHSILFDLEFYFLLKTRDFSSCIIMLEKLPPIYLDLFNIFLDPSHQHITLPELPFNEWLNASYQADIAFIYTLNKNYQQAFVYFQKALQVHPIILGNYLMAYYETVVQTQPSLLRFKQLLHQLESQNHSYMFFTLLISYKENPSQTTHKALVQYIKKEVLPSLNVDYFSYHHHYTLAFLQAILLHKKKKSHD